VNDIILETEGLTREFGGFVAVDNVDLRVRTGQIHALIGPNGAGKTTCFNLLTAFLPPSRGTIRFKGRDITHMRPAMVARLGLVRSFQISAVFPHLTALENVRLALQRNRHASFDFSDWKKPARTLIKTLNVPMTRASFDFWRSEAVLRAYDEQARALLEDVGLKGQADTVVVNLPYGLKRALEIATTLALEPEMLLLDEPTAGMAHGDVDRIVDLIRRIRAGRTILMVEHNLSVVEGLCDTITVLTRGRVLAEGDYAEVSKNPEVIAAYLGSETAHA
jgi:branched-chain amino acid transport system ATP-binding protein